MIEPLDQTETKERYDAMSRINDRGLHFILDFLFAILISLIIGNMIDLLKLFGINKTYSNETFHIFLSLYFLYYFISELIFKKTLGKRIRNTRIVDEQMNKPKFWQIFVRSLIRLIPFEFITIFMSSKRPLHDILSKTYVIKSIKL